MIGRVKCDGSPVNASSLSTVGSVNAEVVRDTRINFRVGNYASGVRGTLVVLPASSSSLARHETFQYYYYYMLFVSMLFDIQHSDSIQAWRPYRRQDITL